jgi:hypothetical protein
MSSQVRNMPRLLMWTSIDFSAVYTLPLSYIAIKGNAYFKLRKVTFGDLLFRLLPVPRCMPPYAINFPSSSDDDEAPESISLARSKWNTQQDDGKIKRSLAAQKRKRDERLKASSKQKRPAVESDKWGRAVHEDDGEAENEKQRGAVNGVEVDNDNTEAWGGVPDSETSENDEEMALVDGNVEDGRGNLSSGGPQNSLDALRLPDHLFAAASKVPSQRPSSKSTRQISTQKKAKKQMQASRSLILG